MYHYVVGLGTLQREWYHLWVTSKHTCFLTITEAISELMYKIHSTALLLRSSMTSLWRCIVTKVMAQFVFIIEIPLNHEYNLSKKGSFGWCMVSIYM